MSSKRFICLCLAACLLHGCSGDVKNGPTRPATEVSTIVIEPRTVPAIFEYVGVAQSSHLVEIRARVEGYLEDIAYQEGALVHKDQLLFQLDARPFKAALESAKGDLAKAKAVLWNANRTVERLTPLYEQKAASLRDLDDAIAHQLSAAADEQTALAKVEEAELRLSYTTINSPISGLSGQSSYRQGALISPGPNSLLTTVSVINPIWVNFSVSDRDILKHREELGKSRLVYPKDFNFGVDVILADGSQFPETGRVEFADPSLQQSTGTMNVRAILANPDGLLKPGQFVKVKVTGAERPNAIIIPQAAVMQGKRGMFVYIVDKENKAQVRYVEPGTWFGDDWIIETGLDAGEEVIIDGTNKVGIGAPIVRKPPPKTVEER